jgi:hypothetical protein
MSDSFWFDREVTIEVQTWHTLAELPWGADEWQVRRDAALSYDAQRGPSSPPLCTFELEAE